MADQKLPKVISYALVDARTAGGTLALVKLVSRGKVVEENEVVGVFEHLIDALDAFYNYGHARWYVREPLEKS